MYTLTLSLVFTSLKTQ
ncbi:mCG125499, isoform CRA_d [Mus musculus]|nr:mCG125499, isoform CRA_d [Mus musculus]